MKKLQALVMVVLSVGWLIPLYLGINSYLTWAEAEVTPRLAGQSPINSFPFLRFADQMLGFSLGWLAIALGAWTVLVLRNWDRKSPSK